MGVPFEHLEARDIGTQLQPMPAAAKRKSTPGRVDWRSYKARAAGRPGTTRSGAEAAAHDDPATGSVGSYNETVIANPLQAR
jgi:hypothetical protein